MVSQPREVTGETGTVGDAFFLIGTVKSSNSMNQGEIALHFVLR